MSKVDKLSTPGKLSPYMSDALVSMQEIWLEDEVFDAANTRLYA